MSNGKDNTIAAFWNKLGNLIPQTFLRKIPVSGWWSACVVFAGLAIFCFVRWSSVQSLLDEIYGNLIERVGAEDTGIDALVLGGLGKEPEPEIADLNDGCTELFESFAESLKKSYAQRENLPFPKLHKVVGERDRRKPEEQFLTLSLSDTTSDAIFLFIPPGSLHGAELQQFKEIIDELSRERNQKRIAEIKKNPVYQTNLEIVRSLQMVQALRTSIIAFANEQPFKNSEARIIQSFVVLETNVFAARQARIDNNTHQQKQYEEQFTGSTFLTTRSYYREAVTTRTARRAIPKDNPARIRKFDHVSNLYIDLAMNGPVRTYCWAFTREDTSPWGIQMTLGLDVSIPEVEEKIKARLEQLGANPKEGFFDLEEKESASGPPNARLAQLAKAHSNDLAEVFGKIFVFPNYNKKSTEAIRFIVPLQSYLQNQRRIVKFFECELDVAGLKATQDSWPIGGVICLLLALAAALAAGSRARLRVEPMDMNRAKQLAYEVEQARIQMMGLFPAKETYERLGIKLVHRRLEATTVSGDFYGFIPRRDGSVGIFFVDVEGHGLSASNQARSLYQALTADREWGLRDAFKELEKADELVSASSIFQKEDMAFCMNFTEIDAENMEIRHANAGMPPPLLFRWEESEPHPLRAAGTYIGAGYSRYPVKPQKAEIKVGDGDVLVIVSDGILEARDSLGKIFGPQGVTAAVLKARQSSPEEIADEIIRAVRRHTRKEIPDDDQALVVVQLGSPELQSVKTLISKNGTFNLLNGRNDLVTVCHRELRADLEKWLTNHGLADTERTQQIWGATWEAIHNALRHGSKPGEAVTIRLSVNVGEGYWEVEVSQPVAWEDWDKWLGDRRKREIQSGRLPEEGWGTIIMLWLAHDIRVYNWGRSIAMRFFQEVMAERKISIDMNKLNEG